MMASISDNLLSDPAGVDFSKDLTALKAALKDKPAHEYARHPGVIALLALRDFIDNRLCKSPFSYSYAEKDGVAGYRFADTYGWRIVLKIDDHSKLAKILHLSRVRASSTSVDHALRETLARQPPPQSP